MKRGRLLAIVAFGAAALYVSSQAEPTKPLEADTTISEVPTLSAETLSRDQVDSPLLSPSEPFSAVIDTPVEPEALDEYGLTYPTVTPPIELAGRAPEFDESRALYDARREAARWGYRGFCTSDCSGHEAGYQWAHENRLTRPGYTYDSNSFDEGQEAYVRDVNRRVEEMRVEFEDDPEQSEYGY